MTTRELAVVGERNTRPRAQVPRVPGIAGRKLCLMPLADGRCNLVEAKTRTLFMPCASRAVAETMRDVFST